MIKCHGPGLTSLLFFPKDGNTVKSQMRLQSFNSAKKKNKKNFLIDIFNLSQNKAERGSSCVCVHDWTHFLQGSHWLFTLWKPFLHAHTVFFSGVPVNIVQRHQTRRERTPTASTMSPSRGISRGFSCLCDGELTFLRCLFVRSASFTSATLVVLRVERKFVITLLTATFSVLVTFTFGDHLIVSW